MINSCAQNECEERFKKIEERLRRGNLKFAELGIKLDNLVSAQRLLTKAIWGLASSIIIALFSFVLGKI